ncbi:hypothetical protein CC2G_005107 [Coprinopsis cinerea AmutBmut pab1-1]|nr:hypothetical protein CC2G_005107 [Coprinopsis cinerea AmutBmut pab1-1]
MDRSTRGAGMRCGSNFKGQALRANVGLRVVPPPIRCPEISSALFGFLTRTRAFPQFSESRPDVVDQKGRGFEKHNGNPLSTYFRWLDGFVVGLSFSPSTPILSPLDVVRSAERSLSNPPTLLD